MEYLYSRLISPVEYETEGLCEGIPLRMHKDSVREDIGTTRCQKDWNRLVGPLKAYRGGLDAKWNFMSVSVPECLPERLEIISYANEFAFLYDDETEDHSEDQLNVENDKMEAAFREAARTGSIESRQSGKRQIQGLIFNEMMAIYKERAQTAVKGWAEFLRLAAGRQHGKHLKTLEEYIPYRSIDVGKWFWYGVVTFGMALTIPPKEMEVCESLMMPAWTAAALQNDIFSWAKERDAARHYKHAEIVNAVWVLMHEHSIGEAEALELCREKTKGFVAE